MDIIIKKSSLKGDIKVPSSKSLAHRAIIASFLANGRSVIKNITYSKDIEATINGIIALGGEVKKEGDSLIIDGGRFKRNSHVIDCNESGSTLRFLIPISLLLDDPITFTGHNNLCNRPLDPYFEIFKEKSIEYYKEESYLPLKLKGKLTPGEYRICGNISSQFITGLLFALPLLNGDSRIIITTPLESKGYVDLTLDILRLYNIEIINNDYKSFIIKGNQHYKPQEYIVEGDYSQAAFYLCMDALGAQINLLDMNLNSHQADVKILKDLEALGSKVIYKDNKLSVSEAKENAIIDLSQSPDLGPALAALMGLLKGEGDLINAQRLRLKECDRIEAMATELGKCGISTQTTLDTIHIKGVEFPREACLDSHNDHRVAMALSILALKIDKELKIKNAECVLKSYPSYWDDFISLGGDAKYE